MDWNIPLTSDGKLSIPLEPNTLTFVVGPNGSGKSALIQHAVMSLGADTVRRISAHRQTWLPSAAIDLTPQSRRDFYQGLTSVESDPTFRWQEWDSQGKLSAVLFDLTAKENELARRIMERTYSRDSDAVEDIISSERPVFEQINELLKLGGLAVSIKNSEGEEILAEHEDADQPYSMAQMSDGERNAVILAANVLTVSPGTVILIDEPERHLHRSIIELFLTALFAQRKDCSFVVSTHDVGLPMSNPEASVIVVRSCSWNGSQASTWDAKLLKQDSGLPENLKRAILGSRRKILFAEGEAQSLDIRLYSALFPNITVVPAGSCDDVIRAVTGLRGSQTLHDVESFGLIDGDNRSVEDVQELENKHVYALGQYSVESLYYCSVSMKAVADRQSESLGINSDEMIKAARNEALAAFSQDDVVKRMAARRCEREFREVIQLQIPDWRAIMREPNQSIVVSAEKQYIKELSLYRDFLEEGKLEEIIARYPVRQTKTLDLIAKGFQLSRNNYERTLLTRVRSDSDLAGRLRAQVGPLADELT